MTDTRATRFLGDAGAWFQVHIYELADEVEGTYGESVARALGVEPDRLFKTLIATVDSDAVVAIVPVSARLSTKNLARAAGGKRADMTPPDQAERLTGYVTGGISPFGQRRALPFYVDETIELFETVFVSAGQRGVQLELAPETLVALLDATIADLTA